MIIQTCGPEPEPEAMAKACALAARWLPTAMYCTVHTAERKPDGWLEYGLDICDADSKRLIYIGLIQRTVGAEWESHS